MEMKINLSQRRGGFNNSNKNPFCLPPHVFCLFYHHGKKSAKEAPMILNLDQARAVTDQYGQSHLLRFYGQLSPAAQTDLLGQIGAIDFELMNSLYHNVVLHPPKLSEASLITPLTAHNWSGYDAATQTRLRARGLSLVGEGKVAAVLVAGGQGTRLGHPGPKGTYNIGLPSGKSLFQLQAERLLNLGRKAGKVIPWYIMTSADNHTATTEYFRSHRNFGYPGKDLFFFSQDQLPVLDESGKILLSERGKISLGPNGNGGCFLALAKSGALADMNRRGVDWIFLYGIDNVLVRVCDPGLIGFAAANNFPAVNKTVAKASPEENVGVLGYRNGRPAVIEYTELPPELAHQRDKAGNLLYGSGNIVTHLFRRDFLEQNAGSNLPYHVAHKKIATIDANGDPILPAVPNAYKFELFMFDIFPLLSDMTALQVRREEEFAPVKNKEGADSPATARNLLFELHRQWLLRAGVHSDLLWDRAVEISPLLSFAGEGLEKEPLEAFLKENRDSRLEISSPASRQNLNQG
jgi:UDP-N-acetylglucosamine/UDP-N-acetylgalactosamine diphosphorylase